MALLSIYLTCMLFSNMSLLTERTSPAHIYASSFHSTALNPLYSSALPPPLTALSAYRLIDHFAMSFATYAPSLNYTPTKPSSVLFQGDVPPSVQRQIVEFSDFHLKGVDFARTTGQRLALKEASVFRRPEDAKLQSRLVYEITVAQGKHPFCSRSRYFPR